MSSYTINNKRWPKIKCIINVFKNHTNTERQCDVAVCDVC